MNLLKLQHVTDLYSSKLDIAVCVVLQKTQHSS